MMTIPAGERQTWPDMERTRDRDVRRAQRPILEALYPDYYVPRHGAFVDRYNAENERARFQAYLKARKVI